jgi:hypothetical protein
MFSLEQQLEQLKSKVYALEKQLTEKDKVLTLLENTLIQSLENEQMTENENLMLDCENQYLFEQNQEYLNGSLYQEIWEENQSLLQQMASMESVILPPPSLSGVSPFHSLPLNTDACEKNSSNLSQLLLSEENRSLKNRILELETSSKLKKSGYSSSTGIDISERPSFVRSILELPSKGLDVSLALGPLKGRIVEEDNGTYFRQFIPYILEEVRASMCAQKDIIAKKNRPPFTIYSKDDCNEELSETSETDESGEIELKYWAYQQDLPKLAHGFYNEAVLIVTPPSNGSSKGRRVGDLNKDNHVDGILAIARVKTDYDQQESKLKKVNIAITLPKRD